MKKDIFSESNRSRLLLKSIFLSVIFLISMITIPPNKVYADSDTSSLSQTDSVFDLVIVMDASASMRKSDPNKVAVQAAKLFVDMSMLNNSNVAVISYGYHAKFHGIATLDSYENKKKVKDWISSIDYPEHNGTDTGAALTKAKEVLEEYGADDHQKCIVLFTDGDIEYVNDPNDKNTKKSPRTVAQSIKESEEVSLWGNKAQADCPIYVLGLNTKINGKNTITKSGKEMISTLAANSGGKSKIVGSINSITTFFEDVFGTITDAKVIPMKEIVATGSWQKVKIDIPNSSVAKANIIMLTRAKLDKIKLTTPAPESKEKVFNSTDCVLSREKVYSIIELDRPEKGEWILSFVGEKGTKVRPNLFFLYDDMQSVHTVRASSGNNKDAYINQPIMVESYLKSDNEKVMDKDVYTDIKGTVKVINADTDECTHTFDLTFDESKMVMSGSFTPSEFGTYSVTTMLKSASFHRTNNPTEVTVVDHMPKNICKIEDFSILSGKTKSINLNDHFNDTDGLGLYYQVASNNGKVLDIVCDTVSGSDTMLNIQAKNKGNEKITVTVSDPAGNNSTVSFDVKVNSIWDYVIRVIIILLIIALLTAIFILVLSRARRLNGFMHITVYDDSIGISYGDDYLSIGQSQTCTETLLKLIERFANDVEPFNGPLASSLTDSEVNGTLSSIILTGTLSSKNYAVTVSYKKKNNAATVKLDGIDIGKRKKVLRISNMPIAIPAEHKFVIETERGRRIKIGFRYTQTNY